MENSRAIRSELSGSLDCLKGRNQATVSPISKHRRLFRLEVGVQRESADVLRARIELERRDAHVLIQ